ncbi:MAG: zf-TFIIB domain-containing protein [Fimbriimonadia bacterium]|jgi:Zn-finger nucleic acid-binding protein
MTCPKCHDRLEAVDIRGVRVDACPKCAGIWFDAGELKQLQASGPSAWVDLEARIAPRSEEAAVWPGHTMKVCPQCSLPMLAYRFLYDSNITLDECNGCGGVWVDDNELAAMAEFLERTEKELAGLPKTKLTPEEMDRIAAKARMSPRTASGIGGILSALRSITLRPPGQ